MKFELFQKLNNKDLIKVVEQLDSELIWQDCFKFLAVDNQFVPQQNMIHIKDDAPILLNVYRLYQIHYVTSLLTHLGQTARKFKIFNVALPEGFIGRDGQEDTEQSDYCEDDFKDLMSQQQVQQSIKIFFDRLKEILNPIDE